jgi:hypothetical protein
MLSKFYFILSIILYEKNTHEYNSELSAYSELGMSKFEKHNPKFDTEHI